MCPFSFNIPLGRAMAQAVSRRPLTTEARVRSQVKSMWDLWWAKWHWDMFFSELSVFPCRFHSTGAPLILVKNCSSIYHHHHWGCTKSLKAVVRGPFITNEKKISQRFGDRLCLDHHGLDITCYNLGYWKPWLLKRYSVVDTEKRYWWIIAQFWILKTMWLVIRYKVMHAKHRDW
jgi:hypothetical protein